MKKINEKDIPKKHDKRTIIVSILLALLIIFIYTLIRSSRPKTNIVNVNASCTMISNYIVNLIEPSNDENYKYITVSEFQGEGIYSVKIPTSIAKELEINKRYKFTFESDYNFDKQKEITPDIVFKYSKITNVVESKEDELWINKYDCNK